jgi:hypothetical protein
MASIWQVLAELSDLIKLTFIGKSTMTIQTTAEAAKPHKCDYYEGRATSELSFVEPWFHILFSTQRSAEEIEPAFASELAFNPSVERSRSFHFTQSEAC